MKKILFAGALCALGVHAGVTNPDLSAIGQLRGGWTDDATQLDHDRATLNTGEAELVLDAPLNPYAHGTIVLTAAPEGAAVEEAYADLDQALPWGLAVRAGKYRVPFGRLNPSHPHALSFVEAPRVLRVAGLLPGDEDGWNESAVELSDLLPGVGTWAPRLSLDVQQGSGWRLPDTADPRSQETHLSWLGRFSNGFLVGDDLALDAGLSLGQGTTRVSDRTTAWLAGADIKAKLTLPDQAGLMAQAEVLVRRDNQPTDPVTGLRPDPVVRGGGYLDLEATLGRWNLGVLGEQYQATETPDDWDRAARVFGGFSLMEETTLFRLVYERTFPHAGQGVSTVGAQMLFSMGPHKPHTF